TDPASASAIPATIAIILNVMWSPNCAGIPIRDLIIRRPSNASFVFVLLMLVMGQVTSEQLMTRCVIRVPRPVNIFRDRRDQAQNRYLSLRDCGKNEAPSVRCLARGQSGRGHGCDGDSGCARSGPR